MSGKENKGEGNVEADQNYREATEDFVESGKVEEQKNDLRNIPDDDLEDIRDAEEKTGNKHPE